MDGTRAIGLDGLPVFQSRIPSVLLEVIFWILEVVLIHHIVAPLQKATAPKMPNISIAKKSCERLMPVYVFYVNGLMT